MNLLLFFPQFIQMMLYKVLGGKKINGLNTKFFEVMAIHYAGYHHRK